MYNEKPLVSICIPTYNRCEYLKKTLESIINQKGFDLTQIEIIISDNNSTDQTEKVCRLYANKYSNIKYFKNTENIMDKNFPLVLSKASGELLKLCNDTLLFDEGTIQKLLDVVAIYKETKPVVFFSNIGNDAEVVAESLEQFLYEVSYNITWIGGLCIWGDDYKILGQTEEGCEERLWQVPLLLKYVYQRNKAIIIRSKLFSIQIVEKKNISYGLYKVFYENYLGFVKQYVQNDLISNNCFNWLEKDLLFSFFPHWMINYEKNNKHLIYSREEDLVVCIKKAYRKKTYYIEFLLRYYYMKVRLQIKSLFKRI